MKQDGDQSMIVQAGVMILDAELESEQPARVKGTTSSGQQGKGAEKLGSAFAAVAG